MLLATRSLRSIRAAKRCFQFGGEGTFGVTFTWCFDWGLLFMILMGHWGILSVFTYIFSLLLLREREEPVSKGLRDQHR
jgi:hypothetical protein